jgi:hypothetical protein
MPRRFNEASQHVRTYSGVPQMPVLPSGFFSIPNFVATTTRSR